MSGLSSCFFAAWLLMILALGLMVARMVASQPEPSAPLAKDPEPR